MSKKRQRRTYNAEQKATILRRHLLDKVPISDLCDEYKVAPSVVYGWQKQAFENLEISLQGASKGPKPVRREQVLAKEIESLKAKLSKKDHVIAEVTQEFVALKKELGEL